MVEAVHLLPPLHRTRGRGFGGRGVFGKAVRPSRHRPLTLPSPLRTGERVIRTIRLK